MKKVIELENRWKAYRYRKTIFYIFIAVLVAFIVMLGMFIKLQVYDKGILVGKKHNTQHLSQNLVSQNQTPQNATIPSTANIADSTKAKISFTCRQVIANKLTVRQNASFRSKALGYYERDAIFCANNESVNGLLKTPNGWVSANDAYSSAVNVNMFVDTGFYQYKTTQTRILAQSNLPKTSVEEVRVFDKPNRSNFSNAESKVISAKPKSKPIITSQNLTKEKMIAFKESDFRNTKDYNTAIEVAQFYYDAKDYDKSIQWALNASNADSKGKQKTESFIIYAKSLYLSGKQDQALEVLTRYISSTNAPDAIDALNKMKQGII